MIGGTKPWLGYFEARTNFYYDQKYSMGHCLVGRWLLEWHICCRFWLRNAHISDEACWYTALDRVHLPSQIYSILGPAQVMEFHHMIVRHLNCTVDTTYSIRCLPTFFFFPALLLLDLVSLYLFNVVWTEYFDNLI